MEATFNIGLVAIAYGVAVALAFATLCHAPRFKGLRLPLALRRKAASAMVMGMGLAGLYFSGTAAAGCIVDTRCTGLPQGSPSAVWGSLMWVAISLIFVLATLVVLWFDGQLDDHAERLISTIEHSQDLDRSVQERTASLMEANLNLVREVSDRKAIQEQLARNTEELVRSNQDLEHFAYVASHDLQAPLRGVMGFTQMLERKYQQQLGDDGREYLGFIRTSAEQMQQLISGLLAFSRLGQQNQPKELCALHEIWQEAIQRLYSVIQERKAVIHLPSERPMVFGVRIELVQLLQNLIGNALKFQPGDSPRVDVRVRSLADGKVLELAVQDYGIGIAPEHQDRIFKIFQRLHTSDEFEGTGIGLALCQKIVHHHGGKIWVDSVPDTGSTFYCTLPSVSGQ